MAKLGPASRRDRNSGWKRELDFDHVPSYRKMESMLADKRRKPTAQRGYDLLAAEQLPYIPVSLSGYMLPVGKAVVRLIEGDGIEGLLVCDEIAAVVVTEGALSYLEQLRTVDPTNPRAIYGAAVSDAGLGAIVVNTDLMPVEELLGLVGSASEREQIGPEITLSGNTLLGKY
ncbi:MAG: hypothetical protein ABIG95_03680 [Candidatus Woesearchaeota archaeon]